MLPIDLQSWLKEQLQSELHASHRVSDAANLAIPAAVGRDLVGIGKADAIRVPEPRRIGRVEGFPTELQLHAFRNDEVFEHGEIHSTFAGSAQRVVTGAAQMAKIGAAGDLASDALERGRVVPELTIGIAERRLAHFRA